MAEQTIYINDNEILNISDNNYTNTIIQALVGPEGPPGPAGSIGPPGPRGPRGRAAPYQILNGSSGIYISPVVSGTVNISTTGLALLNSPFFTGIPHVPTAPIGTNTTQAASTEFVRNEIINIGISDVLNISGSGNFASGLFVNNVPVSVSGHTHTASNITDFNSSVSGLLPTIANSGDNRILTSDGTNRGINAESKLTFDGSLPSSGILEISSINPTLSIQSQASQQTRAEIRLSADSSKGTTLLLYSQDKDFAAGTLNTRSLNYIESAYPLSIFEGSGPSGSIRIGSEEGYVQLYSVAHVGNTPLHDSPVSLNVVNQMRVGYAGFNQEENVVIGSDMLSGDVGMVDGQQSNFIAVKTQGGFYRYGGNYDTPAIVINSGLNVGIKKDNPSYTLDVNGSGNFSSGLFVNNIPVSVSGHAHGNISSSGTIGSSSGVLLITQQNGLIDTISNELILGNTVLQIGGIYPSVSGLTIDGGII
jgi:hypothetical protein